MDAGQLFGLLGGVYFLLLAGFAAITAAQALEEDDRAGLGGRVFWSLTKTTLFLGVPTLIGVLILLNSEAKGDSGIMLGGAPILMSVVMSVTAHEKKMKQRPRHP